MVVISKHLRRVILIGEVDYHIYISMLLIHLKPHFHTCHVMKRHLCIILCENKCADQLCSYHTDDKRLRFLYINSTNPTLPKSEMPSFTPSSVAVQPCLSLFSIPGLEVIKLEFILKLKIKRND